MYTLPKIATANFQFSSINMKKILKIFLFAAFLLFAPSFAHAQQYTMEFAPSLVDQTQGSMALSFRAPPTDQRELFLFLSVADPRATSLGFGTSTWFQNATSISLGKIPTTGTGTQVIAPPNKEQGRYYAVLAAKKTDGSYESLATPSPQPVQFGKDTIYAAKLRFVSDGKATNIYGQVDTSRNGSPETACALLEYVDAKIGKFTIDLTKNPENKLRRWSTTVLGGNTEGINHDGTYFWSLLNIEPSVNYSFRETFYSKDSNGNCDQTAQAVIGTPIVGTFNGTKGVVVQGESDQQKDFEDRSYRLLAPFPGLSVLLDPDLCKEKQQQEPGKGQICNINDFLNYIFRLLIGIVAVVLVIRLIIEGFKYATTDIPFLKINAKTKIGQAFLGLLLALSAWIILNTINPKLVENDINIPQINIGLMEGDFFTIDAPIAAANNSDVEWARKYGKKTLKLKGGGSVTVTPCDASQITSVQIFGKSVEVHKNIAQSIRRVDTAWKPYENSYPVTSIGGYRCTTVAGTKNISLHAYGLAIDINPSQNPHTHYVSSLSANSKKITIGSIVIGQIGDHERQVKLTDKAAYLSIRSQWTNMPEFLVSLFKKEGYGWGGEWTTSTDSMHFSKGEKGDMTGE
jgi:hypothetical protein